MSRYSLPIGERAKITARIGFSKTVDMMRAPIRRRRILLVAGTASSEKLVRVEKRLQFLLSHLDEKFDIARVDTATILDYLRSSAVVTADPAAVSSFARRRLRWVADLDYETNPLDAWALITMGEAIVHGPNRKIIEAARLNFTAHVRALTAEGPKPSYIFGTGPSLNLASGRTFSDGHTIVCNTIVRDRDLWHHLKPVFLTAGDALYHFGDNPHARAFRADALRRLDESGGRALFVYPAVFDLVVRAEFKAVESLLIPIPRGISSFHTDVAVDLTKCFSLPPLGNVLVDQLLPLGCTLSRDIRLWGFDGRAPNDSGFWANSSAQSYPELMQSMREAHPAFFNNAVPRGNEIQYVRKVHGDQLEERLVDAERRGFSFAMMHPSWTPTLQKRHRET
ncbi:MAG: hypothetical protein ACKOI2_01730 [Actinomycetota bacterium]